MSRSTLYRVWQLATGNRAKDSVHLIWAGLITLLSFITTTILNVYSVLLSITIEFFVRVFPEGYRRLKLIIVDSPKYFKGVFNNNGAANIQNTRNSLSPLEWIAMGGALMIALYNVLIGFVLVISTYIIFFKEAESLPLTTFTSDSAGIDSVIGVGTGLVVNFFNLIGAIVSTIRYSRSQF